VYVHLHCHQKSLVGRQITIDALSLIPKLKVKILNTGCCGMAGDFGYRHSELSNTIAQQSFKKELVKLSKDKIIITTGFSCGNQARATLDNFSYSVPMLFADSSRINIV
jgi:Fe-S oxidoreductase